MPDNSEQLTNSQVAAALGINERTFLRYKNAGCPQDVQAAKAWRASNVKPRAGTGDEPLTGSRSYWETKKVQLACRRAEIELQQIEGGLIDAEEVGRFMVRQINTAKARLNELSARVYRVLPNKLSTDERTKCRQEIRDVLSVFYEEMSRSSLEYLHATADDENPPEEGSAKDGKK